MNKSFTLIEILVVIVVIGILSAFILVGMSSIASSANIAKVQAFINSMDNALLLGRVSQWKFDELTTAKEAQPIRDSWGSNNGTLYTGSDGLEKISSNCPSGNCLSFDGADDYVSVSDADSLDITNTITVSVWVKTLGSGTGVTPGIIAKRNNGFGLIWMDQAETNIYARIYQSDDTQINTDSFLVSQNIWHNIVLVANTGDNKVRIYLDTTEKGTSKSYNGTVKTGDSSLSIGQQSLSYFNGLIDDVRIYNQAIPTSEIQQNYFVGLNNLYKNKGITLNEFNQRIVELKTNLVKNE